MPDGFEVKIAGVDELNKRLEGITVDLRKKGGRFALRRAAEVIRKAAAAGWKLMDDTGTPEDISKNLALRWSPSMFRRTGDLGFRIGVLGGARKPDTAKKKRRRLRDGSTSLADLGEIAGKGSGNPGGDTFYWRFLEFGTERGVRARRVMMNAGEANASRAVDEFVVQYNKALDRAIKRGEK